jgi:hypothetical protein
MSKAKGNMSASVTTPPIPGRIPTTNPIRIPVRSNENVEKVKTCRKPE